jgi:hypothetical protein
VAGHQKLELQESSGSRGRRLEATAAEVFRFPWQGIRQQQEKSGWALPQSTIKFVSRMLSQRQNRFSVAAAYDKIRSALPELKLKSFQRSLSMR